ncbi:MAG: S8 family serine peptidase [Solirubrobacterales bacterium]
MPLGTQLRDAARRSVTAVLALACLGIGALAAPPAMAVVRPGDGDLSARLAELTRPSVRLASQDEQAEKLSLAVDGPGSLVREGNRVLVDVRFDRGAVAGVKALRAAGAKVTHVSRRYQTVTVAVKPADLRAIAGNARVGSVSEVLAPLVSAAGPATAAASCVGAATSEGDAQLRANSARDAFNVSGAGVTVGILSDSFDRAPSPPTKAAGDVASGDLPGTGNPCGRSTSVKVLDDFYGKSDASDEGRGMAQIVHDLAPGTSIAFASAFGGVTAFANNIRRLAKPVSQGGAGAQVIVDDVVYFEEPFFQDGPVAVAVDEVAAAGASYFSSAGNSNLIVGGKNVSSWEATQGFRDTACPPALEAIEGGPENCMDFDPELGEDSTFQITVKQDGTLTVDLQWAEPWNNVRADLDIFLLDDEDKPVEVEVEAEKFLVGSADDNVGKTQRPVEVFTWENETGEAQDVRIAINRCFGPVCNPEADPLATPRLKFILIRNNGVTATEYPDSSGTDVVGPTIFGHNAAAGALSVGAIRFDTTLEPEKFSSRGPVTHLFGPVSGTDPAPPIPPQMISKPNIVATDGGATTFFGQLVSGVWRFFGTSAAAPHAAAVAALLREANPTLSGPQVRAALTSTAKPVGVFGPDAVGAGLVDAYAAVSGVALPPTISITERPPPLGRNRTPSIGFVANRPASFACTIDGGALQPCVSPFVPSTPLSEGKHGFAVRGTDLSGRTGEGEVVLFEIDSRRPRTFFRVRPRKVIRTRHRRARAVFRFGSNEPNVTFVCRVDGGLFRFCGKRLARRFRIGRHDIRVKARDEAGNVDNTPAVYRFRVKRRG